jgi:transposase
MKMFEYRLYPTREQCHLLMQCLIESRLIYNDMLAMIKTHYAEHQTLLSKYDLEHALKGRGDHVPATTVQMLADRLSKSLKRFLAAKENNIPGVGFPRFKKPNRWHSIQLRQYGDEKNRRDVLVAPERRKQRTICRRKKGSQRRCKACKSAAQTHLKIARQRRDFHCKVAQQYADHHSVIVVEDLAITTMVKNHHLYLLWVHSRP